MLVIANDWNQSKAAPVGNLLNKLQFSHTVDYYATIKKKKKARKLCVLTQLISRKDKGEK